MINRIKGLIQESNNIVVFGGIGIMHETGLNGVRAEKIPYDIEEKYGLSPEEMMTGPFLSKSVGTFYDYYKNVILDLDKMKPVEAHRAVARLEKQGKLGMLITRMVYGLYQQAGVTKVIELHGSVYENKCPSCGKLHGPEHIKAASGVPLCTECQVPLKPGFALFGDRIDNGKITQCANATAQADMLIVAGANLTAPLCRYFLKYYEGNRLVLINEEQSVGDEKADYIIHGKVSDILEQIIPE